MTYGLSLHRFKDPIRRATLAAVLSISAIGILAGMPAKAADFAARDATRYDENPNLAPYGLKDITVVYEPSLWPSGADRTYPDLNFIRSVYIPKLKSKNPDVLVIDIERYHFKSTTTATEWTANINKLNYFGAFFKSNQARICEIARTGEIDTYYFHNLIILSGSIHNQILVADIFQMYNDDNYCHIWAQIISESEGDVGMCPAACSLSQ